MIDDRERAGRSARRFLEDRSSTERYRGTTELAESGLSCELDGIFEFPTGDVEPRLANQQTTGRPQGIADLLE